MSHIRELGMRDGVPMRGYEIDYEDTESWSQYILADGTKVRLKFQVVKIFRLVDSDDNPLFDANGDPEVFVTGGMTVVASNP